MNLIRIVDMTGCISMIALLLHLVPSFFIGCFQNIGFVIVLATGILAVLCFIVSILVVMPKRKLMGEKVKWHITCALITIGVTVIHIFLSEMLM
ncbi:MAG TPA: hypothetical protein VJZ01_06100 [Lachnospiraceae bacterium]|nr:hypothetical protein [Lachnospiraceae bacterium]